MPADYYDQPEGADILHKLQPNLHKSALVESSVRDGERHGVKSGNASEKIGKLILRLEGILYDQGLSTDVHVRTLENFKEGLMTEYDDIPQTYWRQQQQLARDNGQGNTLDEGTKVMLAEQLRDAQRTGIDSWTDYLNNLDYPMWFIVYALEGMSGLSTFNKAKGYYNKRSKGTVAPYPQLDPAALAKVYDAVLVSHTGPEPIEDQQVEDLVQSGNFNKLYSHFLVESSRVIQTPEKPEDVHGEWREFKENNVSGLMEAAQGTPWCIAGRGMAEDYLQRDGGKFYLFFLKGEEEGVFSQTACASVRMEEGTVREISGLKGDSKQYLEDALVPTVMEKVKGLPGGERYLRAFEDKQRLIEMDRKFKAREDFTVDEIRFLYEVDRDIEFIDTYADDPRPKEFKIDNDRHRMILQDALKPDELLAIPNLFTEFYKQAPELVINSLINEGANINLLVEKLHDEAVTFSAETVLDSLEPGKHLTTDNALVLLAHDADPQKLMPYVSDYEIGQMVPQLLAAGAGVDDIARRMDWYDATEAGVAALLDARLPADEIVALLVRDNFGEIPYPIVDVMVEKNAMPSRQALSDLQWISVDDLEHAKGSLLDLGMTEEEYDEKLEEQKRLEGDYLADD